MKIVLHVGAHKTATTFIQNNARNNHKLIDASGVYFVDKKSETASEAFKIYLEELSKGAKCRVEMLARQLDKVLAPALANPAYHTIFLSEENLLGHMLSQKETFYPNVRSAVAASLQMRKHGQISVILTLRRQDTYIESCYLFRKVREKREATNTIYDFLDRIDLNSLSWKPVVQPWVDAFGKENCKVLPYELIKKDATAFARNIFKTAMDGDLLKIKASRSNPGLSRKALRLIELIDRSPIELTRRERFNLGQAIHQEFRGSDYKRPALMHDYMREEIVRRYEDDNRELFSRFMPDFDPMMYSLKLLRLELAEKNIAEDPEASGNQ